MVFGIANARIDEYLGIEWIVGYLLSGDFIFSG